MPVKLTDMLPKFELEAFSEFHEAMRLGFFARSKWLEFNRTFDEHIDNWFLAAQKKNGAKKMFSKKQRERLFGTRGFKYDVIKAEDEDIMALVGVSVNKKGDISTSIYGLERYSSPRGRLYFFGSNCYSDTKEADDYSGMKRVLTGHVVERLSERAFTGSLSGEEALADLLMSFGRLQAKIDSKYGGHHEIGTSNGDSLVNVSPENVKKLKSTLRLTDEAFLTGFRSDQGRAEIVLRLSKGVLLGEFIMTYDEVTGRKSLFQFYKTFVSYDLLRDDQIDLITSIDSVVDFLN